MRRLRTKINGRRVVIRWEVSPEMDDATIGLCRRWGTEKGEPRYMVRIRPGLDDRTEMDALIHELLHAAAWNLDEADVTAIATDLAKILTHIGWKREGR